MENEGKLVCEIIKEFIDKPENDGWNIRYWEFCALIDANELISEDVATKLKKTLYFIADVNGGMFKLNGFTKGKPISQFSIDPNVYNKRGD